MHIMPSINYIPEKSNSQLLGPGGSMAVTAMVIDSKDLRVANISDSRAVVCDRDSANLLTVDHELDSGGTLTSYKERLYCPQVQKKLEKVEEIGTFMQILLFLFLHENIFFIPLCPSPCNTGSCQPRISPSY